MGWRQPGHDAVGVLDAALSPLAGQLAKQPFEGTRIGFEAVELEGKGDVGDALVGFEQQVGRFRQAAADKVIVGGVVDDFVEGAAKVEQGEGYGIGHVGDFDVFLQVVFDKGNGRTHRLQV